MASDERTTCEEVRPLVREATRGGLDEAARGRVHEHLAGCATCRSVAEEERDLDRLLEQQLPRYAAPLALRRRLEARLAGAGQPRPPPRWSCWACAVSCALQASRWWRRPWPTTFARCTETIRSTSRAAAPTR